MNQAAVSGGLRSWFSIRNAAVPLVAGLMLTVFTGPAMPVSAHTSALQECTPGVVVSPDADNDGVTDEDEMQYGTDPNDADMDDDGLTDYDELFCSNSSAGAADSDGDGLDDYLEWAWGSDANTPDTDGDGLRDADEVLIYGTLPTGSDTDQDGISDHDEIIHTGTDPLAGDTDEDGAWDGEEITFGSSPLDASDFPAVQAGPEEESGSAVSAAESSSSNDTGSSNADDIASVTSLPITGAGVPAEGSAWVAAIVALLTGALALIAAQVRRGLIR